MLNSKITGLVRTYTPVLVAWIVAHFGFAALISSAALVNILSFVFLGVYYLSARFLEAKWPQLGWLLGSPTPPVYPSTDALGTLPVVAKVLSKAPDATQPAPVSNVPQTPTAAPTAKPLDG